MGWLNGVRGGRGEARGGVLYAREREEREREREKSASPICHLSVGLGFLGPSNPSRGPTLWTRACTIEMGRLI
jgi:hypothetical protein